MLHVSTELGDPEGTKSTDADSEGVGSRVRGERWGLMFEGQGLEGRESDPGDGPSNAMHATLSWTLSEALRWIRVPIKAFD